MQNAQFIRRIIDELHYAAEQLTHTDVETLVESILTSNKIFVTGAGRSGLMGKAFAMRMAHMGLDSYVVGETITATFEADDLLIVGSGSGETKSLIPMVEKAKSIGGKVAVVTISLDSTLGRLADVTVQLPGAPKDQSTSEYRTIQPMGSLFEQTLLLFYDALILSFMEKKGLDSQTMYGKHANLE
ncbi:6-phospho-3-hexuloisomerase [Oceanobacillus chungangensis]|uniref:6-phospho-3-hexuloisomerase n=1 Tax=Oceanobacillus chungangensis TaxID=1229152 RepID=A0A3D8PJZ8_9BACI|nr:6-phospho-3-hexuloisomerase [Oceanobacillus chungangensis]RDW15515.1 6-phospho-3-hexuloisomerase [Oceanobacillus chungangensis]